MAELLIMARDNNHPDPFIDRNLCYKIGDVVVAMPDGHKWGSDEGLPTFYRVSVPGVSHEDFMELYQEVRNELGELTSRRAKKLRLDLLPAHQRSALNTVGRASLTNWQAISNITQNRGVSGR